jgi:branched-chain amino acid transport system permease protein
MELQPGGFFALLVSPQGLPEPSVAHLGMRWPVKKNGEHFMEILLQQIINGLVLGSMYALVALGYTMVYGIINLINFAHGEVLMVGALTSWTIIGTDARTPCPARRAGWILIVAMLIAMRGGRGAQLHHRKGGLPAVAQQSQAGTADHGHRHVLLLQTLAMIIWKPNPKPYPTLLPREPFEIGGAVITSPRS